MAAQEGHFLEDGTEVAFGVPTFDSSDDEVPEPLAGGQKSEDETELALDMPKFDSSDDELVDTAPVAAGEDRCKALELLNGMPEHNHENRGLVDSTALQDLGWLPPMTEGQSMPLLEYDEVGPGHLAAERSELPFVFKDVAKREGWPAHEKWSSSDTFLSHHGHVPVQVTEMSASHGFGKPFRVELTLKQFVDYAVSTRADWPFYSWERQWNGPRAALLRDFEVPRCFQDDLYDTDEQTRDFLPLTCHLFVLVGGARSGSNVHQDPKWSSAWNTVLHGHKKWVMFPPTVAKEDIGAMGDYKSGGPPAYWWLDTYPKLRASGEELGLRECIQGPGDTVYIPSGWWHAVLNLPAANDVSICCTRNCFLKDHLPRVMPLMRQRYPAFASRFLSTLRRKRPDLELPADLATDEVERPPVVGEHESWRLERRACTGLSLAESRREYLRKGRPLIITGLESALASEESLGCSLEWIRENLGDKVVRVTTNYGAGRTEPPNEEFVTFGEAIRRIEEGDPASTYLYDLPLRELPAILNQVYVPRYFGHCYLQRTRLPHEFQRAWPTLFIGGPGTRSSLHVDQWHGAFWMSVLSGSKRWTIWHPDDVALLSPTYLPGRLAPVFPRLDELEDAERHPNFPKARRLDVSVNAGEVLFVPGGAPHLVVNETLSLAVAGNFIDETNVGDVLKDLQQIAERDARARGLYEALEEVEFDADAGMWEELLEPAALVFSVNDARAVHAWGPQPPL